MTASVLLVCTGNVARSVMARSMLEWLAEAEGVSLGVATAGTHAVEGQPAGARTQAALAGILEGVSVGRHRSHQLTAADVAPADLIVCMEAAHVRYIRRRLPSAAGRTGTLRHVAGTLVPGLAPLATRVAALELASVDCDAMEDVADPAGGDEAAYRACAAELWTLCAELVRRL